MLCTKLQTPCDVTENRDRGPNIVIARLLTWYRNLSHGFVGHKAGRQPTKPARQPT